MTKYMMACGHPTTDNLRTSEICSRCGDRHRKGKHLLKAGEKKIVRPDSVWMGRDNLLIPVMMGFYCPNAEVIIDVCCNARRMWKGNPIRDAVKFYDVNPDVEPDVVCSWDDMPDGGSTVDLLLYDPPHLPSAAASPKSILQYRIDYGLDSTDTKDNIRVLHHGFLVEAKRVLKPDGLVFAKIKDYVHNHRYQWNLEWFNQEVRAVGLTPCDLIVKRDPTGGNLKSGRWKSAYHVRNSHCYWVVVRNGKCEPKSIGKRQ